MLLEPVCFPIAWQPVGRSAWDATAMALMFSDDAFELKRRALLEFAEHRYRSSPAVLEGGDPL